MTEDDRLNEIKIQTELLAQASLDRDRHQIGICKAISKIETIRAKLRDLGYQAPTATGA